MRFCYVDETKVGKAKTHRQLKRKSEHIKGAHNTSLTSFHHLDGGPSLPHGHLSPRGVATAAHHGHLLGAGEKDQLAISSAPFPWTSAGRPKDSSLWSCTGCTSKRSSGRRLGRSAFDPGPAGWGLLFCRIIPRVCVLKKIQAGPLFSAETKAGTPHAALPFTLFKMASILQAVEGEL